MSIRTVIEAETAKSWFKNNDPRLTTIVGAFLAQAGYQPTPPVGDDAYSFTKETPAGRVIVGITAVDEHNRNRLRVVYRDKVTGFDKVVASHFTKVAKALEWLEDKIGRAEAQLKGDQAVYTADVLATLGYTKISYKPNWHGYKKYAWSKLVKSPEGREVVINVEYLVVKGDETVHNVTLWARLRPRTPALSKMVPFYRLVSDTKPFEAQMLARANA